jgi:hypothetical protein
MNGVIDSEQDLGRADLDEQGRYKVQMPFDISGVAPGMASRRIRMAQPYGGGGSGMSFPLVKGTEVIWTCIDGDIDRPVITGVVPNPLNPSVTTTENHSSNVLKTSSGMMMSFHDGSGGGSPSSASSGSSIAGQQQNQKIETGKYASRETFEKKIIDSVSAETPLAQQQQYTDVTGGVVAGVVADAFADAFADAAGAVADVANDVYEYLAPKPTSALGLNSADMSAFEDPSGKNMCFLIPDYNDEGNDTFIRYGMPTDGEKLLGDAFKQPGILSYTDGDYYNIVKGSYKEVVAGEKITTQLKPKWSFGFANTIDYSMGQKFSAAAGLFGSSKLGVSVATDVGASISLKFANSYNYGQGDDFSFTKGDTTAHSDRSVIEVDSLFMVKVDPDDVKGGIEDWAENQSPKSAMWLAGLSAAATLTIGGIGVAAQEANSRELLLAAKLAGGAHALGTYGVGAYYAVKAHQYKTKIKEGQSDNPASRIQMSEYQGIFEVSGSNKTRKEGKKNEIRILARKDATVSSDEDHNTGIKMDRIDNEGNISINAGDLNENTGTISITNSPKGTITLKVGTSSIEIADKKMVFKADEFEFLHSDGGKLTIKKGPGMVLTKGGLVVKDGSVKASKVAKGEDIKGKKCTIGGLKVT